VSLVLLLAACDKGGGTATQILPAYLAGDTCRDHADSASCGADSGCSWFALLLPCPSSGPCPSGVCQAKDPCAAHGDAKSCAADAACMWAGAIVGLCPPGATCAEGGGFCVARPDDGCACACPLACPAGADCPPCSCDCNGGGGGGGGGTCACACAPCPPGEMCPPCGCDCQPPPPSCGPGGDTCTCACPACAPGETCEPCKCDCVGMDIAQSTAEPDPCSAHTDENACLADTADGCRWAAILAPCVEGQPCRTGSCFGKAKDTCICNCPECPAGVDCGCTCDCPPPVICPNGGGTGAPGPSSP
jgi:hypothetical protein